MQCLSTAARDFKDGTGGCQYNYSISHIPGKSNYISDCQSRLPLAESKDDLEPSELVLLVRELESRKISSKDIATETENDTQLSQVKHYIMHGFPATVAEPLRPFLRAKAQLSLHNNCLMYGNRVVIPQRYQRILCL